MKYPAFLWCLLLLPALFSAALPAGPAHDHADEHADTAEAATISAGMAQRLGLRVAAAAPGTIERHIPLYGELVIPPSHQAQVRARFPGMIKEILVAIGDPVNAGDVLARIESNDSLRSYPLLSPIAGVVVQQFAGQGEYIASEPLFSVLDPQRLWAELKVFPAMLDDIRSGLPVHIEARGGRYDSRIAHILPAGAQPYVFARVELDNSSGRFVAGERISALVDAEIIAVALVIENQALQQFEGKAVVFVQEGERYEPRAITLGRSDGRVTEVLAGLHAGEHYVVANSYLIKAELEKSAAAHTH